MSGNEKQTRDDPRAENTKAKGSSWMRQERKTAEVHIFADPGNALKKPIRNHGIERSLKTGILPEIYDSLKKEIEKIESE